MSDTELGVQILLWLIGVSMVIVIIWALSRL